MNSENLSKELVEKLSIDELVDLKIETDDLTNDLEDIIRRCDKVLNSYN